MKSELLLFFTLWFFGQNIIIFSDEPLAGIGIMLLAGFLYLKK